MPHSLFMVRTLVRTLGFGLWSLTCPSVPPCFPQPRNQKNESQEGKRKEGLAMPREVCSTPYPQPASGEPPSEQASPCGGRSD